MMKRTREWELAFKFPVYRLWLDRQRQDMANTQRPIGKLLNMNQDARLSARDAPHTSHQAVVSPGARTWLWTSMVGALLAIIGSVIGLSVESIYADLTPAFLPQALAQDIANLIIVSPVWLILTILALRGSLRAYLLWLGVLTFTVYNYVIYTFSIPFGPLFLLWVAVLGLSIYSLIGGVMTTDHREAAAQYTNRRAAIVVAWFLVVTAILFALLWLSEIVPALLAGTTPQSVVDIALPTNPVHILDLAFFLPGAIITGMLLLRRQPLAYTLAPALIVFLILTGIPILLTPVVQAARGGSAEWGVMLPIGVLTLALLGVLGWLLSTIRPGEGVTRR